MRFDVGANRAAVQAAELVNLWADGRLDAESFSRVYDVSRVREGIDDVALDDLEALVAELAEVFRSADPQAVVNLLLAAVDVRPHLTDHDDRGHHLHYETPSAGLVERVRANTLMGLAVLLCDEHDRIGTCDAVRCQRAWVDTSRNARRRFCSSACANRTHVAAHRARQRADS
jgi:predicted RNA-binding Zn ribbon-like protein